MTGVSDPTNTNAKELPAVICRKLFGIIGYTKMRMNHLTPEFLSLMNFTNSSSGRGLE